MMFGADFEALPSATNFQPFMLERRTASKTRTNLYTGPGDDRQEL